MITVAWKTCPRCKVSKPAHDFARSRSRKDGLDSYCKACTKVKHLVKLSICQFCGNSFLAQRQAQALFCSKSCSFKARSSMVDRTIDEADKVIARQKVRNYIRAHPEAKPEKCPSCKKKGKICAHHDDYKQWDLIRWLCDACHAGYHRGKDVDSPIIPLV